MPNSGIADPITIPACAGVVDSIPRPAACLPGRSCRLAQVGATLNLVNFEALVATGFESARSMG